MGCASCPLQQPLPEVNLGHPTLAIRPHHQFLRQLNSSGVSPPAPCRADVDVCALDLLLGGLK